MAIYRLSAKVMKRSAGQSTVASAAYRSGEKLEDDRTGKAFDFRRRSGVLHAEILAPENAPEWMHDRAQLWNAVEKAEKRKDAQLAREVQLALPHEMTHEERVALVRSFVAEEFVSKGMVADFAIHAPDAEGDQRNHHTHIMLTMRSLTAGGFGPKAREWNDKQQLTSWREHWAEHVNRGLEQCGHESRIDHRSYSARGVNLEPEPKQGPIATEIERSGRVSLAGEARREAKSRNAERRRDATRTHEAPEATATDRASVEKKDIAIPSPSQATTKVADAALNVVGAIFDILDPTPKPKAPPPTPESKAAQAEADKKARHAALEKLGAETKRRQESYDLSHGLTEEQERDRSRQRTRER